MSSHYLYVVQSIHSNKLIYHKVGISGNPKARLRSLQTGNPKPLRLMEEIEFSSEDEARSVEQCTHKLLRLAGAQRNTTGEWFQAGLRFIRGAIHHATEVTA